MAAFMKNHVETCAGTGNFMSEGLTRYFVRVDTRYRHIHGLKKDIEDYGLNSSMFRKVLSNFGTTFSHGYNLDLCNSMGMSSTQCGCDKCLLRDMMH